MRRITAYCLITLFSWSAAMAQSPQVLRAYVIGNDTIPVYTLGSVTIVSKRVFKNERAETKWNKLRRDVTKAYPYAKAAGKILRDIDAELARMDGKKDRRGYLDKKEKELKAEFEDQLKNLTINQGRILIKLIDRETNHTCYHLIKEMKGGFSAFFWQSLARLFGSSLKYDYDPQTERDIETIVLSLEESDLAAKK